MHAPPPRAPLLAWLGGGCFVASLAYFAWTYNVRFGRVQPDGPLFAPILVDLALLRLDLVAAIYAELNRDQDEQDRGDEQPA